jgi:orotidine-5'-phosphate decarboxylase
MTTPYGRRLAAKTADRGQLCVGIDPQPAVLDAWGLPRSVDGLERCARGMVESLGGRVAVFKPQSAFFEAYGSAGIAVLERVLTDVREVGALSLLDVKRGDIGSTMDAYAQAYLTDGSPLAADAITASPYLGFESLRGTIDQALSSGRGVYVLALTSNPEARAVQNAITADGQPVAQSIVDKAAVHNGGEALGSVGIVVGATLGRIDLGLSALHGSILAPGVGAQGGRIDALPAAFGSALPYVLPAASRAIMLAGPRPDGLRRATEQALGEVAALLEVG